MNRIQFSIEAQRAIARELVDGAILWVIGGGTAAALLEFLMRRRGFILTVLELHDESRYYQFALARVSSRAAVITACEPTRAKIMKLWWRLPEVPIVIPNKPYSSLPRRNHPGSSPELSQQIARLDGKNIVLYQGLLTPERDLRPFAMAIGAMPEITLAIMGADTGGYMDEILALDPTAIHIPYFEPPQHLEITSNAYIGIATYEDQSLNSMFCAPNKVYEYGGLSIPMVCNKAPGLTLGVAAAGAAICVETNDQREIQHGLQHVINNYSAFSSAAREFYDSTDVGALISRVASLAISADARHHDH
ncbi:hypothetical protein [Dietzia maris]|uniref:hypothetical protein n=1 Tax=Dietzia maris TaxID=37915 RepID=UPI00223A6E26|nr:hypothetical protein [Dietzia maris]MCT1434816.1 hypothetical protein [Dietzia maris]MCT1522773.1 hypothetical protein [Dietzia maris]